MSIKMKINTNKNSVCMECKTKYKNTPEMYDLCLTGEIFTLCKECVDVLFHKTLSASCKYNSKLKDKESQRRIMNYNTIKEESNCVKEIKPECFGFEYDYNKCKKCKWILKCRKEYDSQWETI